MNALRTGVAVRRPTLDVERKLWRAGHRWVAGIDEVGRGAWAGPLSVGVAVVHEGVRARSMPPWLRDSKALPEDRREGAFGDIAAWCADAAVGHATAEECDHWGMTLAWRLAAHRALNALEIVPDALLIDGPYDLLRGRPRAVEPDEPPVTSDCAAGGDHGDTLELSCGVPGGDGAGLLPTSADRSPVEHGARETARREGAPALPAARIPSTVLTVVGGDARCAALAAASVLAKVVRDRLMREDAAHFPPYGFERNKGYPSPHHQIALRGYGLSAIHRRSWAYVDELPWR